MLASEWISQDSVGVSIPVSATLPRSACCRRACSSVWGWQRGVLWVLVAGLLTATACSPVFRLGDIQPPPGQRIVATVSYDGNSALSDVEISEKLHNRPESPNPADDKVLLDPYQLGLDRKRIESIYAARGYFDAKVTPARVTFPNKYIAQVRYTIDEGEPTKVLSLQLNSPRIQAARAKDTDVVKSTMYKLNQRWRTAIPLRQGDIWNEAAHRRSKEVLTRTLHDAGFAFAQVFGDVLVHRERRIASVTYHVIPGPLVTIGQVNIVGAKAASTDRIRERVEFEPGDVIRPSALADAEQRVLAMGAFSGVRIALQHPSLASKLDGKEPTFDNLRAIQWPSEVAVQVIVTETQFNEIQGGLGFDADDAAVGIFARVGYTDRNFLGGLRTFKAEAKPSLDVILDEVDIRVAPGVEASLQFVQPAIFSEYTQLSIRADYAFETSAGYDSHLLRGSLGFAHTVLHQVTIRAGYSVEYWRLEFGEGCVGCDFVSEGFDELQGLDVNPEDPNIVLAHLDFGVTIDLRRPVTDPRQGFYAAFNAELAVPWVGSDYSYLKLVADIRGYWTVGDGRRDIFTLAGRLKVGGIVLLGDTTTLPLPARLTGGGANGMRGYASGQMGPQLCQNPTTKALSTSDFSSCDSAQRPAGPDEVSTTQRLEVFPIGGRLLVSASIESRFYIFEDFAVVGFLDVGQIWSSPADFNLRALRWAPGFGLRLYTPIGAIRVDLARRLPPDPKWGFHLSLGQAF